MGNIHDWTPIQRVSWTLSASKRSTSDRGILTARPILRAFNFPPQTSRRTKTVETLQRSAMSRGDRIVLEELVGISMLLVRSKELKVAGETLWWVYVGEFLLSPKYTLNLGGLKVEAFEDGT